MAASDGVVQLPMPGEMDGAAVTGPSRAKHLVFVDPAAQALLRLVDQVAPSDAPVHIAGETGTGKELIARYLHRRSGRIGPFLAVNCGAINEELAESELFGHESGSFTGASGRREGWFEAADGGTLFLDEIGDLPLALQGKLLRVLQEGEVTRIGSRKAIPVNVRIVSASNVDLEGAVKAGNFRLDLFYRVNIVPIRLPALRQRPGDIGALAEHFIEFYSRRLKRSAPRLHPEALRVLQMHTWPGNIRELENVIHYSLLLAAGGDIGREHLRIQGFTSAERIGSGPSPVTGQPPVAHLGEVLNQCFKAPGSNLFRDVERLLVTQAYRHCDSNQVRTAEMLGLSRNVLRTLLKRHGLLSGTEDEVGGGDLDGVDATPPRLSCESAYSRYNH